MVTEASPNVYLEFAMRYRDDPVGLVRNVLGAEPDPDQAAVLEDVFVRNKRRISVRSGHGRGKSATAAWVCVVGLTTGSLCKVIETAPSGPQLWDALFAETKFWFNRLPEALRALFRVGVDRIESLAAPEQLFVSARTARAESPEALQGVHAEGGRVIIIGDEASAIPDAVFEAGAGSMSGANCCTLLMSNPTRITGFFFETHHRLKGSWSTYHWSCIGCPRVTQDFLDEMAERYGIDSNQYRVRVLGEFPVRDDSTLIPLEIVTAAMDRDIEYDREADEVWGVDVARFGQDASALVKRCGRVVREKPKQWRRFDTMQLTGAIKFEYENAQKKPVQINVDVIGLGAGVVDRLAELGLPVHGVNVAESPAFDPTNQYERLRDELWGKGKAWLEARDCKLPATDDFYELAVPRYSFQSSGKMKVESKKEMLKRGIPSPNVADAFLLTLADEAVVGAGAPGYKSNWSKPLPRRKLGIV